jgi:hypothetical protein
VGDKTFTEETLPVESVAEYFEHCPILEIDYAFYRSLLESKGSPSSNYHVLKNDRIPISAVLFAENKKFDPEN